MRNVNRIYQKNETFVPPVGLFPLHGSAHKKEDCSVLLDHMYLQVVKIDCLDKVV